MTPAIEMQNFMRFDRSVWEDRSLDAMAKRVIAGLALVLILGSTAAVIKNVSAQSGSEPSALEYEVRELRTAVDELRTKKISDMQTQIELLVAHQGLEDQRYAEQRDFQSKELWALIAGGGAACLAILGWFLQQVGVTFGFKGRKNGSG